MRVALTYNLRRAEDVDQRGYTPEATLRALVAGMGRLGHEVELVEVSGPLPATVDHLVSCRPNLVFNLAEGRGGPWRQALWPAVLAELDLPFTGSGPDAMANALDKRLTKLLAGQYDIATPRWRFVRDAEELRLDDLCFPVLVKPNFESSSKGISSRSLAADPKAACEVASAMLHEYPEGVLVEEFITGRDITVPYLEAVQGPHGGALTPAEHVPTTWAVEQGHTVFDYDLKNDPHRGIRLHFPARIAPAVADQAKKHTLTLVRELQCLDLARADFRLTPAGDLYLLEVNTLPTLTPEGVMHQAAALAGLDPDHGVLQAVLSSATDRHHNTRNLPGHNR